MSTCSKRKFDFRFGVTSASVSLTVREQVCKTLQIVLTGLEMIMIKECVSVCCMVGCLVVTSYIYSGTFIWVTLLKNLLLGVFFTMLYFFTFTWVILLQSIATLT